ncbi:MAG TPA: hypothetical protein VGN42_06700 [Pirellulales bacterium]|jgi:hypothetical protein|nr:hypothetical protein [Pirellulales bacterium]
MKKLALLAAAGAVLAAAQAQAQQPRNTTRLVPPAARAPRPQQADALADGTTSLTQMTPEMWFYQQEMRRYDDPRAAVRRKAEYRAAQRQRRIAAMEWYGYSNSRPLANPTPFASGTYSPGWVSNNYRSPMEWSGGGRSVVYGAQSAGAAAR